MQWLIDWLTNKTPTSKEFDPNQPRDENGMWTDTGASAISVNDVFPESKVRRNVYHGTDAEFGEFNDSFIGENSDHPSSQLGHWFIADRDKAREFATRTGNVYAAKINLKNPYTMEAKDFAADLDMFRGYRRGTQSAQDEYNRSANYFRELSYRLQDRGFDGIIIKGGKTNYPELESDNFVVFYSGQIKIVPDTKAK